MDPYLTALLVDKGVLTAQGLSRKARLVIHRQCGLLTLSGLDADMAAMDAWCDPYPITDSGEFNAICDGRWTYQLRGGRLDYRDRWIIGSHSAEGGKYPVYAAHRCPDPIPLGWRRPTSSVQPQVPLISDSDGLPPF